MNRADAFEHAIGLLGITFGVVIVGVIAASAALDFYMKRRDRR